MANKELEENWQKTSARAIKKQKMELTGLCSTDLLPRLQSAYRRHHSTKTALLRVLSDIYAADDRQDVTLLGLLDLSAAFDCVNHDILISRLQQPFGICGTTLSWIASFLSTGALSKSSTLVVCRLSCRCPLAFGVPEGSVLDPFCCCCCTLLSCLES